MNLIIALLIFGCILYIGWFLYQKTQKKSVFYKDFLQFCELLETQIGFFQNNLEQVLQKERYKKEFSDLVQNFLKNKNLDDWALKQTLLSENEVLEIKNFFSKLGRVDSFTQTKEIDSFKQILKEKMKDIKEVQLKKGKLTFSLSVMLGILAFIIII